MSNVETVMVGTTQSLAEVVATVERVLGNDRNFLVEPDNYPEGFNFAVDVYARVNPVREDPVAAAREVKDLLAAATPWRLAVDFDANDQPTDERPALTSAA